MTTACGSTTSSPGTPKTLSLEEAPFWKYLEILRKEGYEADAEDAELFYVEMLTNITRKDGEPYTKEQVMKTPFKNLVKVMELIAEQANTEINEACGGFSVSGPMMRGSGADSLSEEQMSYLTRRQLQLHEEEKLRQGL